MFTNQRKLNVQFAQKLYADVRGLVILAPTNITLRPISFKRLNKDDPALQPVTFKIRADFFGAFDAFKESDMSHQAAIYESRYKDDLEKKHMLCRNRFLEGCLFEPVDGQHFCEACRIAYEEG